MIRITKERIKLADIVDVNEDMSHSGYPLELLKKSIEENGWNPAFRQLSYHGDSCQFEQPFFVNKGQGGKYTIPNGKHRYLALKGLGFTEMDVYVKDWNPSHLRPPEEIKRIVDSNINELNNNGKGMFQSFNFPYGIKMDRRDNSEEIFHSTNWYSSYYIDKSVLDIACNGGYFAISAKMFGAKSVTAFDCDNYMISKARLFADLYDIHDIDFQVVDFWQFDWTKQYDIVISSQFIYHVANDKEGYRGAKPSSYIDRALDLMCNATKNNLVMFTFINLQDPWFSDMSDGYRPGYLRLEKDMLDRGFKEVRIYHTEGGKSTMVASKTPWSYLHLPECDTPELFYKSQHIDYIGIESWWKGGEHFAGQTLEELKLCYEIEKENND